MSRRNRKFRFPRAPHRPRLGLVLLMTSFLASCAHSTIPLTVAAHLPARPAGFGEPVAPPPIIKGESVRVFALKNRAALHQANNRLEADAQFMSGIEAAYGAKD